MILMMVVEDNEAKSHAVTVTFHAEIMIDPKLDSALDSHHVAM